MEKADIIQLLLSFAGSMDQREYAEWNLVLMEIFYYFFLERDPESILNTHKVFARFSGNNRRGAWRPMYSPDNVRYYQTSTALVALLEEEVKHKRREARLPASRHSRFGGTLSFKMSVSTCGGYFWSLPERIAKASFI